MDLGLFGVMANAAGIEMSTAVPDRVMSLTYWQCVDTAGLCKAATDDLEPPPHLSEFAPRGTSAVLRDKATVLRLALVHLLGIWDVVSVARTSAWLHSAVRPRLLPLYRANVAISRAVDVVQRERCALMAMSVDNGFYFPETGYIAKCAPTILRAIKTIALCQCDGWPVLLRSFGMRMAGLGPAIADVESRYGHLLRVKWHSTAKTGSDPKGAACVAAWQTCFSQAHAWCDGLEDSVARDKARCNLLIADLYAPAISVVDAPDEVVRRVAGYLENLPLDYWPVVIDAALPIFPDSRDIYARLLDLAIDAEHTLPRLSTRTLGEMAVLMICVAEVRDVRGHFISRFGLDERYIATHIEPYMAAILVQEALCPIRIRPLVLSVDQPSEPLTVSSMACVDHWSILDPGLLSSLHSAFVTGVARRVVLPVSEWQPLPDVQKEVVREDVFCMPPSEVAALVSDLHRFWTIYEEIHNADDDVDRVQMWPEVMDMPWQVQPTMVTHLLNVPCGAAVSDPAQDTLQSAVLAWAKVIVPQCLAAGRPRLADRAAASVLKLISPHFIKDDRAALLNGRTLVRFALALAAPIPSGSSREVMSGIAKVLSVQKNLKLGEVFATTLEARAGAFIRDTSATLLYPSSQTMLFFIVRSVREWRALPESGLSIDCAFDAYCERFHMYNEKLRNLFIKLLRINVARDILSGAVTLSAPTVQAWFGKRDEKRMLLSDVALLRAATESPVPQVPRVPVARGRRAKR